MFLESIFMTTVFFIVILGYLSEKNDISNQTTKMNIHDGKVFTKY